MAAAAAAVQPEPIAAPLPPAQENVVLPALRTDLLINQQTFENRTYYVVKDPVSLQYFRMTAEDYYLATLFDGKRTFGQIRDLYLARHPHVLLEYTQEELNERVLRFANDLALLQFLSVQGVRLKSRMDAAKKKKNTQKGFYQLANKVFFWRRSVFDPDVLFGKMAKPLWWMWTKTTLWISAAIIFAGFVVFVNHADRLQGAFANLFSLQNALLMIATTFVIKSIHELGHGLTCKHFGGEVHEIGVMFLVFQPYFFVNITDSWTMPKRMHRILISAAGIYVELIFAAFATFFWAIVQPGTLRDFLFNVIFIASVSTIFFNANPLMRFDGYYIMMDLLEVPNLQAKSRALITHQVKRLIFGAKAGGDALLQRMPLPKKRFWLFYTYALLSWLYGYWIIYSLIIFMKPHLEPLGLEGMANWFSALALTSWVALPFIGFFKSLELKPEDWRKGGRLRRLMLVGSIVLIVFTVMCFVPTPLKITRSGVVDHAEQQQVRPEISGFVDQVLVTTGDRVKPGMAIARLANRDVHQQRAAAEARLKMAAAAVRRALGEGRPAELKQAETIRIAAQAKFEEADRDVRNLTLTAQISGVVLTRDLEKTKGRLVKSGELFCLIAAVDPLRIKIALNEQQVRYVEAGQKVTVKTKAYPSKSFHGVIEGKPVMFFGTQVPPAFAHTRGGDVMTYQNAEGQEVPVERTFEATVLVENREALLRPGMSVRGQIDAGQYAWGRLVLQSALDLVSLDYRF